MKHLLCTFVLSTCYKEMLISSLKQFLRCSADSKKGRIKNKAVGSKKATIRKHRNQSVSSALRFIVG